MSNNLDPDQDRHFVGSDLGTNCLERLSADDRVTATTDEHVKIEIRKSVKSKIMQYLNHNLFHKLIFTTLVYALVH